MEFLDWRMRSPDSKLRPLPGCHKVTFSLPYAIEIHEYVTADGRSPFADWLDGLDAVAAARIVAVLHRIEAGNFGDVAPVGAGVSERRIDVGSGYRVYFVTSGRVAPSD